MSCLCWVRMAHTKSELAQKNLFIRLAGGGGEHLQNSGRLELSPSLSSVSGRFARCVRIGDLDAADL